MSHPLLDLEAQRRCIEQALQQDELDQAQRIREELKQPLPGPAMLTVPLGAVVRAEQDARGHAAEILLRWWQERPNKQGRVTNAQIEALARRIRGLGRGR